MTTRTKNKYEFEISRTSKQTALVNLQLNDGDDATFEFMKMAVNPAWRSSLNWGDPITDDNTDFEIVNRKHPNQLSHPSFDMNIKLSHEELQHVTTNEADWYEKMFFIRKIKPDTNENCWWVHGLNQGLANEDSRFHGSLVMHLSALNQHFQNIKLLTENFEHEVFQADFGQIDERIDDKFYDLIELIGKVNSALYICSAIFSIRKYHPKELEECELE